MEYETAKDFSVEKPTPEEKIQKARERIERLLTSKVQRTQALKSLEEVYEAALEIAKSQQESINEPIQFPYTYHPSLEINGISQNGSSRISAIQ